MFNNETAYKAATFTATGQPQGLDIPAEGPLPARALISVETANIRFFYHGGNPTPSIGHVLEAGEDLTITGVRNVQRFRFVAVSGSPVVTVTLEGL